MNCRQNKKKSVKYLDNEKINKKEEKQLKKEGKERVKEGWRDRIEEGRHNRRTRLPGYFVAKKKLIINTKCCCSGSIRSGALQKESFG